MAKQGKKVWAIPYDFKDACSADARHLPGRAVLQLGPGLREDPQGLPGRHPEAGLDWDGPDWKDINNPDTSAVGFVAGPALMGDAKAKTDAFIKGLADGSIDLFKGPLNFQDGTVYLKDGEKAAWEKNVWYLPQLLQGMTGPSK